MSNTTPFNLHELEDALEQVGIYDYDIWDDTWTVTTKDKKRTAQFEHTLLVTATGSQILTLPSA